jgi:hypothetical protein
MDNNQEILPVRLYKASGLTHAHEECPFAPSDGRVDVTEDGFDDPACVCMTVSQLDSADQGRVLDQLVNATAAPRTWEAVTRLDRLARSNPQSVRAAMVAASLRAQLEADSPHARFIDRWMCNGRSGVHAATRTHAQAENLWDYLVEQIADAMMPSGYRSHYISQAYTATFYQARRDGAEEEAARAVAFTELLDQLAAPADNGYTVAPQAERLKFAAVLDAAHRRWTEQVHAHLCDVLLTPPAFWSVWCAPDVDQAFEHWPADSTRPAAKACDQEALFRLGKFFDWSDRGVIILVPPALSTSLRYDLASPVWPGIGRRDYRCKVFTSVGTWSASLDEDLLVEAVELARMFSGDSDSSSELRDPTVAFTAAVNLLSHRSWPASSPEPRDDPHKGVVFAYRTWCRSGVAVGQNGEPLPPPRPQPPPVPLAGGFRSVSLNRAHSLDQSR